MNLFANAFRRVAGALAPCVPVAGVLLFSCGPAAALYAEVRPAQKVGVACIDRVSLLAPKLATCPIAETRLRIWCPNGQMFEGAIENGGPPAAIARSLCNMSQVP
jgi:hypothetical protein